MKKKSKTIITLILASVLTLNIAPATLVYAEDSETDEESDYVYVPPHVIINGKELNKEKMYWNGSEPVEFCELGIDGCSVFFNLTEQYLTYRLNLVNYTGPEIYVTNQSYRDIRIFYSGENVINSTSEYGIYNENYPHSMLYLTPATEDSSLTINVNSTTSRANGILLNEGNLEIEGPGGHLEVNVNSTASPDEITGPELTGITIKKNGRLNIHHSNYLTINNPTGNYSVSADRLLLRTFMGGCYEPIVNNRWNDAPCYARNTFTHKITNGVGDVIEGNDFEILNSPMEKVFVNSDQYSFSHVKSETLGEFRLIPATTGTSVSVSQEITSGKNFEEEEQKLRESMQKSDKIIEEVCADYGCRTAYIEPNPEDSVLENVSNPSDRSKISLENSYNFIISFKTTVSDRVLPYTTTAPYGIAVLNGESFLYQPKDFVGRSEDGSKIWFRIPITVVRGEEEPEPEPEPEPIEEPDNPEPASEDPETPENPAKPEPEPAPAEPEPVKETPLEEPDSLETVAESVPEKTSNSPKNPETSSSPQILAFSAIAVLSFVIQLTYYGKVIFSLRRNGLRKNHATPPSRI